MSNISELLFLRRKMLMNNNNNNKSTEMPKYLRKVRYVYNDFNDGSCYIDLMYDPNEKTQVDIQIESLNAKNDSNGSRGCPYGVIGSNGYRIHCFDNVTNYEFSVYTARYKTFYVKGGYSANVGVTDISHSTKSYSLKYGTNTHSYSYSTSPKWQSDKSLYLFSYNNSGSVESPYIGKIYYCNIYENSELIKNLIPVYNSVSGRSGLYDTISGTEYYSSGSIELKYK